MIKPIRTDTHQNKLLDAPWLLLIAFIAVSAIGLPNIIPGAKLGPTVLTSLLSNLADYQRKIAIGIENKSGYPWTAITVYFQSGTTDMVLPTFVKSGTKN